MNRRLSWLALAAVAVCALMLAGPPELQALSDEEAYQLFVGTWVNTGYAGTPEQAQVTVIRPDYVGEDWLTPDSPSPVAQWKFIVKKTWADEMGYTYCQYIAPSSRNPGWLNAWLMRVDGAGKVIEFQWGSAETSERALVFPQTIDSNDPMYSILYRQD